MKNTFLAALVVSAGTLAIVPLAHAEVITVGLQESGVNGGAIDTVASATGLGAETYGSLTYGTFTILGSVADTPGLGGLPGLLNSNTLSTSSSTAGVLTVWVTA